MTSCTAEEIRKGRELYRNLKRQRKIKIVKQLHTSLEKSALPKIAKEIEKLSISDMRALRMIQETCSLNNDWHYDSNVIEEQCGGNPFISTFFRVDCKPSNKYDVAFCYLKVEGLVNSTALYVGLIDDGHIRKDKDGKYSWVF